MPELQNGAGREAQEARGNPENPGVRIPAGIKAIDHLKSDGYGIYEMATGKRLMFVPRKEILSAPNPVAYMQAILDVAAKKVPQDKGPVEVPENLSVTIDSENRSYVIHRAATGENLIEVPWDTLPDDPARAHECMQEIVNEAEARLKTGANQQAIVMPKGLTSKRECQGFGVYRVDTGQRLWGWMDWEYNQHSNPNQQIRDVLNDIGQKLNGEKKASGAAEHRPTFASAFASTLVDAFRMFWDLRGREKK